MAGTSNRVSFGMLSPANRSANVTHETLAAIRASAFRNLETSVMSDVGDRRSVDMDTTRFSAYLPNLTFADQLQSARKTLSTTLAADETMDYGGIDAGDITENFTKTHYRLLLDDDPGWKATEPLFADFLHFLLLFPGQQQVFELLRHYEELCFDQVSILRKIIERGAPGKQKFYRTAEMLRYMESELWTWRLIRTLYQDRLDKKPNEKTSQLSEDEIRSLTDLDKWNHLTLIDDQFREMRLVVQWCQQNAADLLGLQDTDNIFEDKTFLWENTLHKLRTQTGIATRKFVKSMDPDAPIREAAHLEDTDGADEQRLLSVVFSCIRAGELDKAVDLCVNAGQPWRAATLKSAAPYHRKGDQESNGEVTGNFARDVWKRMAWQLCNKKPVPLVETAIYGSLSGHFGAMQPLCGSWEDVLWAHAIAASESMFDEFLRRVTSNKRPKLMELPPVSAQIQEAGKLTLEEILHELEGSDDKKVSDESKTAFRRLQSFVFLDKPGEAVTYMHQFLGDHADEVPKHLVRLMAHIVLAFKMCSLDIPIAFANGILEHYVRLLIEDRRTDLIAYYTATLPPGSQTVWYAKFLENVEDKEKRLQYLLLAEKAGLNVSLICIAVVNNIKMAFEPLGGTNQSFLSTSSSSGVDEGLEDQSTIVVASITADVSEKDMRLVNAIEWLLFDPALHGEAVKQANAIGRIFLIGRNLAAVQKLFALLPKDILQSAADAWLIADGNDEDIEKRQLSLEHQNAIREFLCHQAYLDAHITFGRWFEHYHRNKPKANDFDVTEASAVSGAALFQQKAKADLMGRQYEDKMKEWERDLQKLAEDASQASFYVLLYPDGGWMVDRGASDVRDRSAEQERVDELVLLRKRCLPLIAGILVSVLQGSRRYQDALKVADIIASDENCLYQAFSRDQLKHVNRRMAEVAVEAMNAGYDCLGYK